MFKTFHNTVFRAIRTGSCGDLKIKDPIVLFRKWISEVHKNKNVKKANCMCLATATRDGKPSSRFVVLLPYGNKYFKFFTNYGSKKGKELKENPCASVSVYWKEVNRAINIQGVVIKMNFNESCNHFNSTPIEKQVTAMVSRQSEPFAGRSEYLTKEMDVWGKYKAERNVGCPNYWGGYILIPKAMEFWEWEQDEMHRRIRFKKQKNGENDWVCERLAP